MISTPEVCTDNSMMTPNPYMFTKNHSVRKFLHQFSKILDAKNKTAVHRIGAAKAKRKAIRTYDVLW